ncbi:O-antigen ligase family protein [Bradyrhizobium sp. RDT46]|uniref:O-antigen ligase family protein n=1 Tax=Bradyrhizobium sp. RDT46 TaxID=3341829 RepID=UPI0035C73FCB
MERSDFFILAAGSAWLASPNLQNRTNSILLESSKYGASNEITSTGLRLEYWRKSLGFIREAPLLGHGTGSVQMLFDRAALGQTGLAAETISNPHNQTLSAAVQWGLIGCVILYAMWICHVSFFSRAWLLSMAWLHRRRTEYSELTFQFAFVRFCARLDLRDRRQSRSRADPPT